MSDVQFDNDFNPGTVIRQREYPAARYSSDKGSFFASLFIRIGLAKDEKGAERAMLFVTVISFLVAAFIFYELFFAHRVDIPKVMPAFIRYG